MEAHPKYIFVSLLAGLLFTLPVISCASKQEDSEHREELESLRDIPVQVRAAILEEVVKEVDDFEIDDVERDKKNGEEIYEVELEYRNKEIELKIKADGTLLQKTVEWEKEDRE